MSDAILARRIAEVSEDSVNVIITAHAKKQMRRRRILLTQVMKVLQRGRVVEPAQQDMRGNWKCTLELLVSGDLVKIAAVVKETGMGDRVLVITAMN